MKSILSDNLVAADVMERDVVTVGRGDTLREALALMTENHITGLPVMDRRARCVGLVCATDILNYEAEHSDETEEANLDVAQHFNPDKQQWESIRVSSFALESFGNVRVEEVMAHDLVFVTRDMPLDEVAQKMVHEGIHRVLVLDERQQLQGIVSAIDFVRLVAQTE